MQHLPQQQLDKRRTGIKEEDDTAVCLVSAVSFKDETLRSTLLPRPNWVPLKQDSATTRTILLQRPQPNNKAPLCARNTDPHNYKYNKELNPKNNPKNKTKPQSPNSIAHAHDCNYKETKNTPRKEEAQAVRLACACSFRQQNSSCSSKQILQDDRALAANSLVGHNQLKK